MSEELPEQQIGNVPITPAAEPNRGSIPGVSGQKEAELFAAETNKHHREMLKLERGVFGSLFGNAAWAPTNIGGFALVATFLFVGVSFCFPNTPELNEARKWAYALASGALGFLFGSAKSKG
jgi:hypothetical protein